MNALIIDDEPLTAKRLQSLIVQYCFEIKTTVIQNIASEALLLLKEKHFDILFVDVRMPEMSGFDFLEAAAVHLTNSHVIITTAYEQYAIQAFNADAVHYLVKPVLKDDLVHAIRKVGKLLPRVESESQKALKTISIFCNEEYHVVKVNEIIRLEADGGYTTFYTQSGKLLSSKSIGYYEEILPQAQFFRCHQSHLINLNCVEKYSKGRGGYILMTGGQALPLAVSKRNHFLKQLD